MYKSITKTTKKNKLKIFKQKNTESPFSVSIDISDKDFKKLLKLEITE